MTVQRYRAGKVAERFGVDTERLKQFQALSELGPNGPWLFGGALVRLFTSGSPPEERSDFDVACRTNSQAVHLEHRLRVMNYEQLHGVGANTWLPTYAPISGFPHPVQIGRRTFPDIENLLASIDFTVCQIAFDGECICCAEGTLEDLETKTLRINTITHPNLFLLRLRAYQHRGFTPCEETVAASKLLTLREDHNDYY